MFMTLVIIIVLFYFRKVSAPCTRHDRHQIRLRHGAVALTLVRVKVQKSINRVRLPLALCAKIGPCRIRRKELSPTIEFLAESIGLAREKRPC
jgi:hypothetical protein